MAPLAGAESAALAPSMAVANGPAAAVAAVAAGARGTRLAGTAYREIDVLPGGMATVGHDESYGMRMPMLPATWASGAVKIGAVAVG